MIEKRLFVGRKTVEDRFTIINDYENEIGVKENRSGDVIVLKHSDLNAQQFVAQLVVFLNDQNQAIVDLYDGSKYWSDKATERIKELEEENEQLKSKYSEQCTQLDFLKDENQHMRDLVNKNEQLQERNNRQCKQLDDLYRLVEQKDWRSLTDILDDFKKSDELLQKEWGDYLDEF